MVSHVVVIPIIYIVLCYNACMHVYSYRIAYTACVCNTLKECITICMHVWAVRGVAIKTSLQNKVATWCQLMHVYYEVFTIPQSVSVSSYNYARCMYSACQYIDCSDAHSGF